MRFHPTIELFRGSVKPPNCAHSYLNLPSSARKSAALDCKSEAVAARAFNGSTAWLAAPANWPMFVAIVEEPEAASVTERAISLVVAVCSSTAAAIVVWKSLI